MADKITNDDRNSFGQIISNGREFGQQLTYFPLKPELQKFDEETYDKMIDGTTDTFIFAEGLIPDTRPRVISEMGFIDKQLFIDSFFDKVGNMTIYEPGTILTFDHGNFGPGLRARFEKDVLFRDHVLHPDRFGTETTIAYVGQLIKGKELYESPSAGFNGNVTGLPLLDMGGAPRKFYAVKIIDGDDRLQQELNNKGPQTNLLDKIYNDKQNNGWKKFDVGTRNAIDGYIGTTFTGLVIEVVQGSVIDRVHCITGNYQDYGDTEFAFVLKSPGETYSLSQFPVNQPIIAYDYVPFENALT